MTHPAFVTTTDRTQPDLNVVTDEPVKCDGCGRTVAWKATRPYRIACRHCKQDVER